MDQQFNDLPMPDEETSWQEMKKMLEEDEDDIIPPPIFLKSCLGWGILLLAGLTIAWLVVRPEKWWNETTKTKPSSSQGKIQKQVTKESLQEKNNEISKHPDSKVGKNVINQKQSNSSAQSPVVYSNKNDISFNTIVVKNKKSRSKTKVLVSRKDDLIQQRPIITGDYNPAQVNDNEISQGDKKSLDTALTNQQDLLVKDSIKKEIITQPLDSPIQKTIKPSQKKLIVVAGVGLQQQIPIAGQTAVPYSYYGRESSWADYVPSVYLQLQKEKKWFVMGEFRFGAAQSVKELSYNQHTRYDTASMNVTKTTMRLKKTYYHQLPLSFNYYLIPNLSVGIGGMYSRFYGAITEKETDTWNAVTQTNTSFKEIIPVKHFTDSFLYKTQVHILMQADYQWKRFSFGLRYTKDLQPYIRYTKPDGTIDEEKNQSLQVMVRFRVWQSSRL